MNHIYKYKYLLQRLFKFMQEADNFVWLMSENWMEKISRNSIAILQDDQYDVRFMRGDNGKLIVISYYNHINYIHKFILMRRVSAWNRN